MPTQIYAHRGARRAAPENTMPAFQKALEMGVDGIELDVHLSADGDLVVIHDFTVDKTTSGSGRVERFTTAQLAALDAGSHFSPAFAGVGVPTLAQVLDLIGDRCIVNIEIKSEDPEGGNQVAPVAAVIRERNLYDQVIVSSFNPISLIAMRHTDPRIALGLLYYRPLPVYLRVAWMTAIIAPQAIHPEYRLIDAETMAWGRTHGCNVNTWTVNEIEDARRLAALGVDVLMSDVPDELMAALS
ncbi:MAG: hypothetical protein KBG20_04795 [Caldilineaceae bacterium]|nr:hypothetical protein [Caldilineaceae bacterium]MBP8106267.1 hypothetical protein [Caldilineaceae bacterium]MBP8121198.1 hypothetical protein [Caldilineaceae bacterium]MBP9071591.1 hypothetical protein [Caldilineaceae bacterium]